MRPPWFWENGGVAARLLAPLEGVTAWATARRVAQAGFDPGVPVFCAGNATMGGAGKTTVALDWGRRLVGAGRAVHFLSRGYGGRVRGTVRVQQGHGAAEVGDEPLLLARVAPCWVGADRAAGARAAVAAGAEVLVMDDGLQNSSVAPRHTALVVDGEVGFGNGRLFPAGPLREAPARAAGRCEVAVVIGAVPGLLDGMPVGLPAGLPAGFPAGLPVWRARLVLRGDWRGRRVHAFAGIARPGKFFASLEGAGAMVAGRTGFADHAPFTAGALARLLEAAGGLPLVTTAKDAVRLPPGFPAEVAEVGLEWEQPELVDRWLGA